MKSVLDANVASEEELGRVPLEAEIPAEAETSRRGAWAG